MLRSLRRRAVSTAVVVASLAIAACAGNKPLMYGDYTTIRPSFELPPDQKPLTHVDVTLGSGAYVALLYVVPGRGSLVVFPDSTSNSFVQSGTHAVMANFPKIPSRDSLLAAARARARQAPGTRGTRDSSRISRPLPDLSPGTSPYGYLLLFTSPSPIAYADLKTRVEGITIPIDDEPALKTVVKLVRSALPEGAAWAAYAKQIDLQ